MTSAGAGRRRAAERGPAAARGARAQGLHIAALAAAIKVAPRKLELLEADRFDELPDATFTRALAQTVCRGPEDRPGADPRRCCRRRSAIASSTSAAA